MSIALGVRDVDDLIVIGNLQSSVVVDQNMDDQQMLIGDGDQEIRCFMFHAFMSAEDGEIRCLVRDFDDLKVIWRIIGVYGVGGRYVDGQVFGDGLKFVV